MASVTKTIPTWTVDGSGNPSVTTSLYFASFEDFMEYERVVNEKGQQDNQTTLKELVVEKEYRVVKDISDHGYAIGSTVQVIRYDSTDNELPYQVVDDFGDHSWLKPEEVEEI